MSLGRVLLPPTGSSVGQFEFLLAPGATSVAIDTAVAADTEEGVVVGVVTDLRVVGPDADPLRVANTVSSTALPPLTTGASDAVIATVQVFHAPNLRPVRGGSVRAATEYEMGVATGKDTLEWPVAMGVVRLADGTPVSVCTDGYTLLGTEASHMMIAGRSGAAAKTSYASVMLKSVLEAGDPERERVAGLVFNCKGSDLVFLDHGPTAGYELTDDDLAMYAAMGVTPTPFEDVLVYAPSLPGGGGTRSERADAIGLRWGLRDMWTYLRYFAPSLYDNDNSVALIEDLGTHKVYSPSSGVDSVDAVVRFLESELSDAEEDGKSTIWRNHHTATARRVLKFISSIPERTGGLVSRSTLVHSTDVPVDSFVHGQVTVVDIAGLDPLVQSAVIARTLDRLVKQVDKGYLGVDHLVVFADELNVFSPQSGGEVPAVRTILSKIAATGRYAGLSLWGAAQFMSQVATQVRDNASTWAFGVLAESELDSGVYGKVPAGRRERIVTLPKGSMMVRAYNFRGLITVAFPRPAWRTGKPKGPSRPRPSAVSTLALSAGSLANLSEGLTEDQVTAVVARHDGDTEAAARELDALRTPNMQRVSAEGSTSFDRENVWDLE